MPNSAPIRAKLRNLMTRSVATVVPPTAILECRQQCDDPSLSAPADPPKSARGGNESAPPAQSVGCVDWGLGHGDGTASRLASTALATDNPSDPPTHPRLGCCSLRMLRKHR